MARVDALITAGGRGTRINELGIEKPMIPVLGVPLIDRVLKAVRSASLVQEVYVSVSGNTPRTAEHLRNQGVEVIVTSGAGYCEDLNIAMSHLQTDEVFVCPADLPLLTPRAVNEVITSYAQAGVGSYSVAVPHDLLRELGIAPTFRFEVNGVDTVLCGVSVVNRRQMLALDRLTEGYLVTHSVELAVNVNTVGDLARAEEMLRQRGSRSL